MVWTLAYSRVDELSSNHCSFHCMSESECNGPGSHQMWALWLRSPWFWTPWPWFWKKRLVVQIPNFGQRLTLKAPLRERVKKCPNRYLHCSIFICVYYIFTQVHEEWSILGPLTIYYCCGTCTNTIAMHLIHKKEVSTCWSMGWVCICF